VDATVAEEVGLTPRIFTSDWHSHNVDNWRTWLAPLVGRENVVAIEIGSWEGRSACWLLDNVLTHPSSRLYCIDPWYVVDGYDVGYGSDPALGAVYERFQANVGQYGALVVPVRATSSEAFPAMLRHEDAPYADLIYIDGNHTARAVLEDAVCYWRLLNPGGLMIFDDYEWAGDTPIRRPRPAIDAFVAIYTEELEVIGRGWQVAVRKCGGMP
jgi:predicted O-methyltransferase YrrM